MTVGLVAAIEQVGSDERIPGDGIDAVHLGNAVIDKPVHRDRLDRGSHLHRPGWIVPEFVAFGEDLVDQRRIQGEDGLPGRVEQLRSCIRRSDHGIEHPEPGGIGLVSVQVDLKIRGKAAGGAGERPERSTWR